MRKASYFTWLFIVITPTVLILTVIFYKNYQQTKDSKVLTLSECDLQQKQEMLSEIEQHNNIIKEQSSILALRDEYKNFPNRPIKLFYFNI